MDAKQCCAEFYENDSVKLIFGESLHPGGLNLTAELADEIGISKDARVLDLACGNGETAIFLAKKYNCKVVGIDLAEKNVREAISKARSAGVNDLTEFVTGDAENLSFEDNCFDFVIAECSFCLFPDKQEASREMYRVLKSGGKLGMSDVIVNGKLPDKMKTALYKFICIQDAKTDKEYKDIFETAGFRSYASQDKKVEVLNLLENLKKKVFAAEIAKGLGKVDLDLDNVKDIMKQVRTSVEEGLISYALIIAEKKSN